MSEIEGFLELQKELEEVLSAVQRTEEVLELGAREFVKDLMKLPRPKSQIRKSGYTHLVDTFAYQRSTTHKGEVEVGWGKYYGRMVEEGTKKSRRQPHLKPTFDRNKNRYYNTMIKELKLK